MLGGSKECQCRDKIVSSISIVHPHGTVGELKNVPFGGHDLNEPNYFNLATRIKTYTEQIEDGGIVETMHEMMQIAQCIVFLGFSYGEQNMDTQELADAINRLERGFGLRVVK